MATEQDLARIEEALAAAREAVARFTPGAIDVERKAGGDPVTEADHVVDGVLREILPNDGEGWLSEETADSPDRLGKRRVWIVDPIDGTKEFVQGIPEWCISVGLVEDGVATAGGICCPAADRTIVGGAGCGVRLNGEPAEMSARSTLEGATVLASRSETRRGEWERFQGLGFHVEPMGSVALKLGYVAAGLFDTTWTLVPKNEWDIAAGAALVAAGGGTVWRPDDVEVRFNERVTKFTGLIAAPASLVGPIRTLMDGLSD